MGCVMGFLKRLVSSAISTLIACGSPLQPAIAVSGKFVSASMLLLFSGDPDLCHGDWLLLMEWLVVACATAN